MRPGANSFELGGRSVTVTVPAAGAGVGLARVRAVVEGAGGSVVATLRPGGGAIFGADWPAQLPWLEPRAE